MSKQMIANLSAMGAELRQSDMQVVMLVPWGKSFCLDSDLTEMQAQMAADSTTRVARAGIGCCSILETFF